MGRHGQSRATAYLKERMGDYDGAYDILRKVRWAGSHSKYRIPGNFGGKNIWRIALIMALGGFYFGSWVSLIP